MKDTESIYLRIVSEIAARYGKKFGWAEKAKIMGSAPMDAAERIVEMLELPLSPLAFLSAYNELTVQYIAECELLPGADRLVRHFSAQGIPVAVATSCKRAVFELKYAQHREFFDRFDHIVFGDDPELVNGKPAPDIFWLAMRRFLPASAAPMHESVAASVLLRSETAAKQPAKADNGVRPAKCLVFEDSPNGVRAAVSAGMHCVMIPDKCLAPEHINGPAVIPSLLEFEPEAYGLPKFPPRE